MEGNSLARTHKKILKTTTIDDGDKRIKLAAKSTILCKQHRQHRRDCHQPAFTALTFAQGGSIRKKCGGGQTKKKKNSQRTTLDAKINILKAKGGRCRNAVIASDTKSRRYPTRRCPGHPTAKNKHPAACGNGH